MVSRRDWGLFKYGPSLIENSRQAAVYVDKMLNGPSQPKRGTGRPTRFELMINLKSAKALGHTIPQSILARGTRSSNESSLTGLMSGVESTRI